MHALILAAVLSSPVYLFDDYSDGAGPFVPTFLEDFEDGKLDPGITAHAAFGIRSSPLVTVMPPSAPSTKAVEGSALAANTYWIRYTRPPAFKSGLKFEFDEPVTSVGFVLTDYPAEIEEIGLIVYSNGERIGSTIKSVSELAELPFIGVSYPSISAFQINVLTHASVPFIQIDHLQTVPEPSGLVLGLLALAALLRRF